MVHGIGINDSVTPSKVNGKLTKPYSCWKSILQRCYSSECQSLHPTYVDCIVCDEWKYYSNFLKWYETNYVEGYQIDKDILQPGNKIYSPEFCIFVPPEINTLLCDSKARRGKYLIGVSFIQREQKFQASISIDGKPKNLGYFDSEIEAHEKWRTTKINRVREIANEYHRRGLISGQVRDALFARNFT